MSTGGRSGSRPKTKEWEKGTFFCKNMEELLGIGIVCYEGISAGDVNYQAYNPIYCCSDLQKLLLRGGDRQERPYIYEDAQQVCFACIKCGQLHYLIGPMCTDRLDRMETHRFYRIYGIPEPDERRLRSFTISRVLTIVKLAAWEFLNIEYGDEELLYVNHITEKTDTYRQEGIVSQAFRGKELHAHHHSYSEERRLLEFVKQGKTEEVVEYAKRLDNDLGLLSACSINHWKNVSVVGITLVTRGAIEAGVAPYVCYKLSDYYIQKCDACTDIAQLMENRNCALEEMTELVREKREQEKGSLYIEACKEYIERHYREKIYIREMADKIGISENYLSRLFHEETGMRLQEYLVRVRVERAANLLLYSEESLAMIAEYVHFPSQSYFGRVFKKYKKDTPARFREKNKPSGF